mmetsp:Transcript_16758/g.20152  ORF Transcript_16758/g.20152 Transcript_16758/m.20152 type:complete len:133 (-) Transcript_16758:207-605(-)
MKHVDDDEAGLLLESCFSDKNINDLYNYLMSGGYVRISLSLNQCSWFSALLVSILSKPFVTAGIVVHAANITFSILLSQRVEKLDFMKSMPTFQYGDRQTYLWALDTVQSLVADKMKSSRTEPHMSTARCPA